MRSPSESRRSLLAKVSSSVALSKSPQPPPPDPDAEKLAKIEARLVELREAEKLFVRTREEVAARSEAVAARERLVSQRERELDDREDGKGSWDGTGLSEMEARLRRLEEQQPGEQTLGFAGGLRKLEQGTRTSTRTLSAANSATLYTLGALAQLGERRLCKAEVAGSIPARSTLKIPAPAGVLLFRRFRPEAWFPLFPLAAGRRGALRD